MRHVSSVVASILAAPGSVQSYVFDRMLGVSTREIVLTNNSVVAGDSDNNPYSGSQWLPVRRVLKNLKPGEEDVFADLGSGKGKVLLIAGMLPYKQVIGVELDEALGKCAQDNICQAKRYFKAGEVTSVVASALEWPVPDNLSVVFLFNPFMGETFHRVVERILDSYDRKPRDLRIIYGLPGEHDWLISTGRVVVDDVTPSNWPSRPGWWERGDVLVTYRVVPTAAKASAKSAIEPGPSRHALRHWSKPNGFRLFLNKTEEGLSYSPAGSEPPA